MDLIPYKYEIGIKFLEPFDQLIFIGSSFPVATFAYKNKPTFKSPPGCDLFAMASAGQDLEMVLKSLEEATGATGASTPRQPRTEAAQPSGEADGESNRADALHAVAGACDSR